jgi:hypothetical protein
VAAGSTPNSFEKLRQITLKETVKKSLQLPSGYQDLLQELKARIRGAQVRAAFAITRELVLLYWSIGREISQRFDREDWGGKIVDRLSKDLQAVALRIIWRNPLRAIWHTSASRLEHPIVPADGSQPHGGCQSCK